MMIQIDEIKKQNALGNEYSYVEMSTEKHSVLVVVCKGERSYVQVLVQNAMNRAWRGMGKQFDTVELAVANYKTDAIKAMIRQAAEIAA